VPIRSLVTPLRFASDPPGPFAGGRRLRILFDLPATSRAADTVAWEQMTIPIRDHMLWSQCQRDDIEVYWFAEDDGDSEAGAIHLGEVDRPSDLRMFTVVRQGGARVHGISMYRQLEEFARPGSPRATAVLTKAAIADELRVDIVATDDQELLELTGGCARRVNSMTTTDALAEVGLFLRAGEHYEQREGTANFRTAFESLAWSAVRAQIPAGWTWSSALVDHDSVANDDATLIFSALFERLTRALSQRDILHRAMNMPAGNASRKQMVEAFDYIMVNLVGAFDATARSAHLGAGLPWPKRTNAKWQSRDWRRQLGVPALDQMFSDGQPADDLFFVLRQLRNTVHGAGLGSLTARKSGTDDEVLATLPRDDAAEVVERLTRLDPGEDWGMGPVSPHGTHFNAARMTEALLPRVFATLNDVVTLCPTSALKTTGRPFATGPGSKMPFDPGTRTRACLLYGLPVPAT